MNLFLLLSIASLPFIAKTMTVAFALQGYVVQSLYKFFQLLDPVLWRFQQGKRGIAIFWPIEEKLPSCKLLFISSILSVFLSALAIVALSTLLPFWALDPQVIRMAFDDRFSVGPREAFLIVVFLSFLNSALEEFHFRMWLDRELSKKLGNIAGVGLSAAAFGCMHGFIFFGLPIFPYSFVAFIVFSLFLCGISWSVLMRKSGGFYAAWWSHALTDALLLSWGLSWLGYI